MKNFHLRLRNARYDQIAAYAAKMAGTDLDVDPKLEAAGIEHLLKTGKARKSQALPLRLPNRAEKSA
jgi:hypothetical protein